MGAAGSPMPGTSQLSSGSQPLWPRFKYNDFGLIAFGQRLRVDMRYWPKTQPSTCSSPPPPARRKAGCRWCADRWTDMRFELPPAGAADRLRRDDLSQLKDHYPTRKEFPKAPERRSCARCCGSRSTRCRTSPPRRWRGRRLPTTAATASSSRIGQGQSYLDFLQKLAERFDFEIFLEFANLGDAGLAAAAAHRTVAFADQSGFVGRRGLRAAARP